MAINMLNLSRNNIAGITAAPTSTTTSSTVNTGSLDTKSLIQRLINLFSKSSVEADKQSMLSAANKQLISSGLGGSTRAAAISAGLTSELERGRKEGLAGALSSAAGLMQSEKQLEYQQRNQKLQEAIARASYGRWKWDRGARDLVWETSFGKRF